MFSLCPLLCHLFTVSRSKLRWLYFCFSRCHIITNNQGIFNLDTFFDGKFLCIISLLFSSSSSTPPIPCIIINECGSTHAMHSTHVEVRQLPSSVGPLLLFMATYTVVCAWLVDLRECGDSLFSCHLAIGNLGLQTQPPSSRLFCWYWEFKF